MMDMEKSLRCKCAYNVWKAEMDFRNATERLNKIIREVADFEEQDAAIHFIQEFTKDIRLVEETCGVDLRDVMGYLKDAEWYVKNGEYMDAKWSLLFASSKLMELIRKC